MLLDDNMTADRQCDLCGENDFERLAERDRRGQPLATAVCRRCGLVSHAQIPTREELAEYYASKYRHDYHGEYAPAAYRVVREWRRGQELVRKLRSHVSGGRVLEIGSGIGCTVMNFTLAGYDASGIEPGEGFSLYSRQHLHAQVRQATIYDLPPAAEYDLVLLVHVLEHLPSPTDALSRIGRLLRPQGKLYIEVPNFARPHAAPGKQFHFAHIYNFTPATLRMVAAKTGYRIAHAFTSPHDKVIGFLLERTGQSSLRIEGTSYTQTMEAARRFSRLSYYVRTNYLLERALIQLQHAGEKFTARWQLPKILEQCAAHAAAQESSTARRAG